MAKARIQPDQTVYVVHHKAIGLKDVLPDPDGPLIVVRIAPGGVVYVRQPDGGKFLDGTTEYGIAKNLLVLRPKADQLAEDEEKRALFGR
jgi:hypothetical protein